MCDYQVAEAMSADNIAGNVEVFLKSEPRHDALFVAPLGSMFDPREVPPAARRKILKYIDKVDCRLVATETRMEFLDLHVVEEFTNALPGKKLRINVGLESTFPWVLANSIGKSIPIERLADYVGLLHSRKIEFACNILYGSILLSPFEALVLMEDSVREAFSIGVDLCVLFPANVRRWTVQEWLWQRGQFEPPSLWGLIEVVWRLRAEYAGRIALSYFDKKLNASIVAMPTTCPRCWDSVKAALWEYAETGEIAPIGRVRSAGCGCRSEWLKSLEAPAPPLQERARTVFEALGKEVCGVDWWQRNKEDVKRILSVESSRSIDAPFV